MKKLLPLLLFLGLAARAAAQLINVQKTASPGFAVSAVNSITANTTANLTLSAGSHLLLGVGYATADNMTGALQLGAWGDSMTVYNGPTASYLNVVGNNIGYPVQFNGGVGGETSTQIRTRFHADPTKWTYATIFEMGTNNAGASATVQADIAACVADCLSVGNNRYLVMSLFNSSLEPSGTTGYNDKIAINAALAATYGTHYTDARTYWVNQYDPMIPSDVVDFMNDVPPGSQRVDTIHPTVLGSQNIGAGALQQKAALVGDPGNLVAVGTLPYVFSQYSATPDAFGTITPNTGAFTTLAASGQFSALGLAGFGTASPTFVMDAIGANTRSQIHVGNAANQGGWISALGTTDALLSGGAAYEGSAWTARGSTTAGIFYINSGAFTWFANSALTNGNTFTPTSRMTLATNGTLGLTNTINVLTGSLTNFQGNFSDAANRGFYINTVTSNQAVLSAGSAFESSAWVARGGTSSSQYHLSNAGVHVWYSNTGLTNGNTYSPTSIMTLSATGALNPSGGIVGVATNSSAAAGVVGEYISSTIAAASGVSLSTGTTANVTSISLTAGDWDVWGVVYFTQGGTTTASAYTAGISQTSATLPGNDSAAQTNLDGTGVALIAGNPAPTLPIVAVRVSLAGTTTVYLPAQSTFAVSTQAAFGGIFARRRR